MPTLGAKDAPKMGHPDFWNFLDVGPPALSVSPIAALRRCRLERKREPGSAPVWTED